jgi:pimeloyl-ACP methyl ester carboxylesterase
VRAALALAAVLAGSAGAKPIAATLPDGRTLVFDCRGRGQPTILFEAGWGADRRAWRRVMKRLPNRPRACAYDRAGAGGSSPGPLPRDGPAIARDLALGLQAARLAGPFLLVGHSAGALYMRQFAADRPVDVAGMVFLDPTPDDAAGGLGGIVRRAEACLAAATAGTLPSDDPALARCGPAEGAAMRWEARLAEIRWLAGGPSAPPLPTALGRAPLVVLAAGRGREGPPGEALRAAHAKLAAQSSAGTLRIVPEAGHLIMHDAPDAVAAAISEVLALLKGGSKGGP